MKCAFVSRSAVTSPKNAVQILVDLFGFVDRWFLGAIGSRTMSNNYATESSLVCAPCGARGRAHDETQNTHILETKCFQGPSAAVHGSEVHSPTLMCALKSDGHCYYA